MKTVWSIILLFTCVTVLGQMDHVNIQKNFGAAGYDLVSYSYSKALKGNGKYVFNHEGISYKFSSKENLASFENNPSKYLPEYGGWCAYAMATKGEKVKVNPKTFELRGGKLYLFYDAYFDNTYEDWIEEEPEALIIKANENWEKILNSDQ